MLNDVKYGFSNSILEFANYTNASYCFRTLRGESDSCEQKVNKHLLADSSTYFGLKRVINASKHVI